MRPDAISIHIGWAAFGSRPHGFRFAGVRHPDPIVHRALDDREPRGRASCFVSSASRVGAERSDLPGLQHNVRWPACTARIGKQGISPLSRSETRATKVPIQMMITRIFDCTFERWSPGIGDPGPVGWSIVLAYLVAAGASLSLAARRDRDTAERVFWTISGAGLLFLAINKQLDLQSLLTAGGRCAAQLQGWYDGRRAVQAALITVMLVLSVVCGAGALWFLRGTARRTGIALLGLVWITGFVLVRAAGFHHVDRMIGVEISGLRLNWAFELGGIAVFLVGCAVASRARPTAPR